MNAWVIHQNESVFGPDTASYLPERWLENPAQSSEMERNFLAVSVLHLPTPTYILYLELTTVRVSLAPGHEPVSARISA